MNHEQEVKEFLNIKELEPMRLSEFMRRVASAIVVDSDFRTSATEMDIDEVTKILQGLVVLWEGLK